MSVTEDPGASLVKTSAFGETFDNSRQPKTLILAGGQTNMKTIQWDGQNALARAVIDLFEKNMPSSHAVPRDTAVDFLRVAQGPFTDGTLLLQRDGVVFGFGMLCKTPLANMADVVGVIHPDHRRQGHGTRVLNQLREILSDYPQVNRLRGIGFDSNPEGRKFFSHHGFSVIDEVCWSEWDTHSDVPRWARDKMQQVDDESFQYVRGHEFKNARTDWAQSWWRFVEKTAEDVPSKGGPVSVAFEEWCTFMESSQTDLSHSLLVLEKEAIIGVISLGLVVDGAVNINYTGVASTHRRLGISTALKLKALELAEAIGARRLVTQNHRDNPILALNQRLGFQQMNLMTEYLIEWAHSSSHDDA